MKLFGSASVRVGRLVLLSFGLVTLIGCGGGTPKGSVSGTVSVKGKNIAGGEVNFIIKEKGIAAVAKIDSSGKYAFDTPLDTGTYVVYLTVPPPEPVDPSIKKKAPAVSPSEIPKRYRDPATSGLSFPVNNGKNEIPIDMVE